MSLHAIEQQLTDFVLNSTDNIVNNLGKMRMYDQPLVAVASAEDMLWEKLKEPEVIGPHHLSPTEWLGGARSVISCFMPFTERVRSSNRSQGLPAIEWLYGRYEGGMFNDAVRRFLVDIIRGAGDRALAPALDSRFSLIQLRSNWSERHVAFIAGLGTFCLNRSLITDRGSAGRLVSVITDLALEPTSRRYGEVDEYCAKCGACIRRCPASAIDENGKNNAICALYVEETKVRFKPRYGCGKCQTGVPCEARRPAVSGL